MSGEGTNYVRVFHRRTEPDPTETAPGCVHLAGITQLPEPRTHECAECVAIGDDWVHLRMCLDCGHVACCDSSKNRHASAHYASKDHPVIRGIEPGERWIYCFVDLETERVPEPDEAG